MKPDDNRPGALATSESLLNLLAIGMELFYRGDVMVARKLYCALQCDRDRCRVPALRSLRLIIVYSFSRFQPSKKHLSVNFGG